MLNLDTHILIFALKGKLTAREERVLSSDQWGVSAIVLWEIAKLAQLGRIDVSLDDPDFRMALGRIMVWPIDYDVCRTISRLDFQGDPADELIAATSVVHGAPLVTRDRRMLRSKLTPLAH